MFSQDLFEDSTVNVFSRLFEDCIDVQSRLFDIKTRFMK